jgi:MYXO-CTERM domain-containing protein
MKMLRIGLPAALITLLAVATAFADTAPGDDTYDYTCEDFCARAASCQTSCFPTSCLQYCSEHTVLYCTGAYNCGEFNSCACPQAPDDDVIADDDGSDDGGDDNDDNNDASGGSDDDNNNGKNGCGCVVSRGGADWVLPALMALVGLAALGLATRGKRRP